MWHAVILAVILSPAPPDIGTEFIDNPAAMQALKDVAICLDLWESQEGWGRLDNELHWAWGEYRALANLPPSSDRHRFPDATTCAAMLAFNWDVQYRLEARAAWNPHADAALADCKQAYNVWSLAYSAANAGSVNSRRLALGGLRDALGANEYHLGRLPPHVPPWMFTPVSR